MEEIEVHLDDGTTPHAMTESSAGRWTFRREGPEPSSFATTWTSVPRWTYPVSDLG
jgi:hypothetical protein